MGYTGHTLMESSISKYNAIPRRRYRNDTTGETSIWLLDVLDKSIKVNRSDTFLHRDPGPFRQTAFSGVHVVPAMSTITEETLEIYGKAKTKKLESIHTLIELFERVVEMEWDQGKFHFVMHSSGYDSRMLSETIRRLWLKNGDWWLGDVLFVCNKFEGEQFRKIMEYQGWDESQYMVVGENVPVEEYHAPSLDFSNAWKKLNCVFGLPVNLFYYLAEAAQACGRMPEDKFVQSWCNYLVPIDYTLKLDLLDRHKFLYYHAMGGRNFKGENMEFPGAHPVFLSGAIEYETDLALNQVKRAFVRAMDKGLADIDETRTNLQGDWGRDLSDRLFRKSVSDYKKSWYGKRVNVRPEITVGFNRWWRAWSIASFCEHLIGNGYKLEME